jgi:hypothetical protein
MLGEGELIGLGLRRIGVVTEVPGMPVGHSTRIAPAHGASIESTGDDEQMSVMGT